MARWSGDLVYSRGRLRGIFLLMADVNAGAPETLEGWYALHRLYAVDRAALRALGRDALRAACDEAADALRRLAAASGDGWSVVARLIGSRADVMFIDVRPTLDDLADAQHSLDRLRLLEALRPVDSFVSVTEVGLYHLAASGADDPRRQERVDAERASDHVRRRLYPALPSDMPYVSFYPMSRRRDAGQNWYTLPYDERRQLVHAHGLTGRRYAGRVVQIITGSMGFERWEWGVTLFARDPLDFKKIVTEMRFDEASARYAEFGDFHVGRIVDPERWLATLAE